MNKILGAIIITFFSSFSVFAQTQNGEIFSSDEVKITFDYVDCNYPSKGVYNQYIFLDMQNLSSSGLEISYDIEMSYNGKETNPDVKRYTFELNAGETLTSTCDDRKDGMSIFSKFLTNISDTKLTKFEIINITINGEKVK